MPVMLTAMIERKGTFLRAVMIRWSMCRGQHPIITTKMPKLAPSYYYGCPHMSGIIRYQALLMSCDFVFRRPRSFFELSLEMASTLDDLTLHELGGWGEWVDAANWAAHEKLIMHMQCRGLARVAWGWRMLWVVAPGRRKVRVKRCSTSDFLTLMQEAGVRVPSQTLHSSTQYINTCQMEES